MGKAPPSATITFYFLSLHGVLSSTNCDKITELLVDEKTIWEGTALDQDIITINKPELFGGDTREGGITGEVQFLFGRPTQTANPFLAGLLGVIPAFKNNVTMLWRYVGVGSNYYLKPWMVRQVRIYNLEDGRPQWNPDYAEPLPNMINAVHALRECISNTEWGLGYGYGSVFEESAWEEAAEVCFGEGMGFGFTWDKKSSLLEFMDVVKRHIQATVYRDPETELWTIFLIRKIVDTSFLPVINKSNLKTVNSLTRREPVDLINQVTVKYYNSLTKKPDAVRITNTALRIQQGRVTSDTVEYLGAALEEVARKLCAREVAQVGSRPYMGTLECDRTLENLHPGHPFIFDVPELVPQPIIVRVESMDLGTINSKKLTVNFVQDFFSTADTIYEASLVSGWTDPITDAVPVLFTTLMEASYYDIAIYKGDMFARDVPTTDTFIFQSAASPNKLSISAGLWSTTGSDYRRKTTLDFCFFGSLSASINRLETSITVTDYIDRELLTEDGYLKVGSELMGIVALSAFPIIEVKRGVIDTVPVAHLGTTPIFGVGDFAVTDGVTYVIGETVHTKLTTKHPRNELLLAEATAETITLEGRMHLPYPPANVKLDGDYWPASRFCLDFPVTWATRNRFTETAGLISFYEGTITSEPSVTYNLELIRTDTSAVLYSATGITGTSDTLSLSTALPSIVSTTFVDIEATTTFSSAHGLTTDDVILHEGATEAVYNGVFIVSVVSPTVITYLLTGSPVSSAAGTLEARKLAYFGEVRLTLTSENPNGLCLQPVIHTFNLVSPAGATNYVTDSVGAFVVDSSGNPVITT